MSIEVIPLSIPDVRLIKPRKFGDHRGFFSETWSRRSFTEAGIAIDFVQDNHSLSAAIGTVRGLHFQAPPFAQDKLVRVIKGRILDVAVDLRRSSPTFGKWVAAELSSDNWHQLLVPIGFAHGFCTLEADTEVIYKVSHDYAPQADFGVAWNDPDLGIDWPVSAQQAVLSAKDAALPRLRDVQTPFA
ncbi:MAG: dTDP-4-dehydrorhamnose 3,5-epimerase [Bosea sp. (in: a-proteobacteria)]